MRSGHPKPPKPFQLVAVFAGCAGAVSCGLKSSTERETAAALLLRAPLAPAWEPQLADVSGCSVECARAEEGAAGTLPSHDPCPHACSCSKHGQPSRAESNARAMR